LIGRSLAGVDTRLGFIEGSFMLLPNSLGDFSPKESGQKERPSEYDGTFLKPILHRVDEQTQRFVRLRPDDRQLYLPFVVKAK
jgi:hypothetical protein